MGKSKKKYIIYILLAFSLVYFNGCQKIEKAKIKMGLKNTDFEYIKNNKADKIIIQSTRDPGFRFIVTDKRTITNLYDILSSAKKVEKKSSLDSDYVFEIYEGSLVHKFNYITGVDKKEYGNLYDENNTYIVSDRIDNDIISNMWNIRKPREFEKTYYGSIIAFLEQYGGSITRNSNNIGIDISSDIDVAKYILSMDLESFKKSLSETISGAKLVNKDRENFDVLITIKTQGYKTDVYKAVITVYDKKDKSEKKYYINNKHENGQWTIMVSDTKPKNF